VWVRLEGRVKMTHSFFPQKEEKPVDAVLTGFLEVDPKTRQIRSVRIVTGRATYGEKNFGVAIRSIP
jgi:hypothetical protein